MVVAGNLSPGLYGMSWYKDCLSVAGHYYCQARGTSLSQRSQVVAERPIDSYDSVTGDIDATILEVEIIGSICC